MLADLRSRFDYQKRVFKELRQAEKSFRVGGGAERHAHNRDHAWSALEKEMRDRKVDKRISCANIVVTIQYWLCARVFREAEM